MKETIPFRAMDFVSNGKDIGLIRQVSDSGTCSVEWLLGSEETVVAWFTEKELEVVDSLQFLLARAADSHASGRKHNLMINERFKSRMPV